MTAKHWIVGSSSLAVAAVLAAGCGDDDELVELTGEEAEALALRVGAVSSIAWFEQLGDVSGGYGFLVPCSGSGNVTFSGTSKLEKSESGRVTSFDVDGTLGYHDCREVVGGGETMTLSGTVNEGLSFAEQPVIGPTNIFIKGTWKGTVAWSRSNGDSGECEVDLALHATWSNGYHGVELFGGLDGTFCTIAVDAPFEEWYETQ